MIPLTHTSFCLLSLCYSFQKFVVRNHRENFVINTEILNHFRYLWKFYVKKLRTFKCEIKLYLKNPWQKLLTNTFSEKEYIKRLNFYNDVEKKEWVLKTWLNLCWGRKFIKTIWVNKWKNKRSWRDTSLKLLHIN